MRSAAPSKLPLEGAALLLSLSDSLLVLASMLPLRDLAHLLQTCKPIHHRLSRDAGIWHCAIKRDVLRGHWLRPHPKLLSAFPKLRFVLKYYDLKFAHNVSFRYPLDDESADKLAKELLPMNGRLQFLRFYKGRLSAKGVASLQRAISAQGRVVELQLWENPNVGNMHELLKCSSLVCLSLHANHLGDADMLLMASALRENATLKNLYLGTNNIGDAGIAHLAQVLRHSNLCSLGLSTNHIGDEGALALAEALQGNRVLNQLFLAWNQVSNQGARALIGMLDCNKTLGQLLISGNRIDVELMYVLSEATKLPRRRLAQNEDTTRTDN
jgi:hypothetical protein